MTAAPEEPIENLAVRFDRSIPGDVVMWFKEEAPYAIVVASTHEKPAWLPRQLTFGEHKRHLGACILYDGRELEVVRAQIDRRGHRFRYFLAPWPKAELPRRVVPYDYETVQIERREVITEALLPARQGAGRLLVPLWPLLGLLPFRLKCRIAEVIVFDVAAATVVSAAITCFFSMSATVMLAMSPERVGHHFPLLAPWLESSAIYTALLTVSLVTALDMGISFLSWFSDMHGRGLVVLELISLALQHRRGRRVGLYTVSETPEAAAATEDARILQAFRGGDGMENGYEMLLFAIPAVYGMLPAPVQMAIQECHDYDAAEQSRRSALIEVAAGSMYALVVVTALMFSGALAGSPISSALFLFLLVEGLVRLLLILHHEGPVGTLLASVLPLPARLRCGFPEVKPGQEAASAVQEASDRAAP
ncbi:MAG: hypothetical protein HYV63_07315 [Candidatus Schekmanbacteria bacterium]|nr:hypothetical protein [Candidatus Schekmanbacteria bacterium]